MIIPYNTDAPIYHLPIATGAIIFANVVIYFLTTHQVFAGNMDVESIEWLILQFNQINPLQWITGSFMHAGLMHLIGNMVFLWTFGLVVEGKIGALMFTVLYFVITLIDGAAVQVPMYFLSGESGALGASGVIFGLMMIAVIWAPENEMDCLLFIMLYVATFEVRIVMLGGFFILMQLAFLFLSGFSMSSEMLHMIGAAIGAPIGFWMLRRNLVDCEGWDLVSRSPSLQAIPLICSPDQRARIERDENEDDVDMVSLALAPSGGSPATSRASTTAQRQANAARPTPAQHRRETQQKKREATRTSQRRSDGRSATSAQQAVDYASHPEFNRLRFVLRQAIESTNLLSAQQAFQRMEQLGLSKGLSETLLSQYANLLKSGKKYVEMVRPLTLIANLGSDRADDARVRLAMIQLRICKDPQAAAATLMAIEDSEETNQAILKKRDELLEEARRVT